MVVRKFKKQARAPRERRTRRTSSKRGRSAMTLRIVFMGTPDFAVPTLAEIVGAGHEVVAAYSQPPRAAGRGMAERQIAGADVRRDRRHPGADAGQASRARPSKRRSPRTPPMPPSSSPTGCCCPAAVLAAPRLGCFNLHASTLPRWRGAAPIQRAIMAGDTETAVMVMRMEQGLDTGPVCLAEPIAIGADRMTAGELHDVLAQRGAAHGARLAALERGSLDCTPQASDGVTYAAKIDKAEARIDFNAAAREVHNLIRGLSPFPGAWFEAGPDGEARAHQGAARGARRGQRARRAMVLDDQLTVACGSGAVRLHRAAARRQDADAGRRGAARFSAAAWHATLSRRLLALPPFSS